VCAGHCRTLKLTTMCLARGDHALAPALSEGRASSFVVIAAIACNKLCKAQSLHRRTWSHARNVSAHGKVAWSSVVAMSERVDELTTRRGCLRHDPSWGVSMPTQGHTGRTVAFEDPNKRKIAICDYQMHITSKVMTCAKLAAYSPTVSLHVHCVSRS
jgi:hypothetical protein